MRVILASKSPFRTHALDVLGLDYETIPSEVDESLIRSSDPCELVRLLSEAKSRAIGKEQNDSIVIAADLVVVLGGMVLEKPVDESNAREMLRSLSGRTFDIVTGLSVFNSDTGSLLSTSETCKVTFRELSDFEISDYVSRFPAVKCAGAFEADGLLRFAERIEGSYNFKAAIPVDKLVLFLRENGVRV